MVLRIPMVAGIPRHISPHSLRHAAITNALDAGVPLRDAWILARHADPRTTQHYDRARGNLDRQGVHSLTVYVPESDARKQGLQPPPVRPCHPDRPTTTSGADERVQSPRPRVLATSGQKAYVVLLEAPMHGTASPPSPGPVMAG